VSQRVLPEHGAVNAEAVRDLLPVLLNVRRYLSPLRSAAFYSGE